MDQTRVSTQIDLALEADFDLGMLSVQPSRRQLRWNGQSSTLEPRLMQVLVALGQRADAVVSRYELFEACWGGRIVGHDALDRCISRLRKVGAASGAFTLQTIPRVGYRLTSAVGQDANRGEPPTLAVLPFVNRSGLAEDEVFAQGMVEDIIDAFAQGVHVRVFAAAVTAGLRGAAEDIPSIGRRLGARFILEGSVRRTGENLRVSTRLVEAQSGAVIHSGRFERPLARLSDLQEDLVLQIAGSLESEVYVLEIQRALKKPANLTAWEATRRALGWINDPGPESFVRAVEEAERAISIDPSFAQAHALLAQCLGLTYLTFGPDDAEQVQRIRELAETARRMAPDELFVLINVGGALAGVGLPQLALPHLLTALKKSPHFGPLNFVAGWTYATLDQSDDSIRHLDKAAVTMPITPMLFYIEAWRANALIRADRWEEARGVGEANVRANPFNPACLIQQSYVMQRLQRHDEARELLAQAAALVASKAHAKGYLGRLFANSRHRDDILACMDALWPRTQAGGPAI